MSELCCANSYPSGKAFLPQQCAAMLKFIRFRERKLLYDFTDIRGPLLMNLYRFFSNLIYLRARVGVSAALRWLQHGSTDSHRGHGTSKPRCVSRTRSSPAERTNLLFSRVLLSCYP